MTCNAAFIYGDELLQYHFHKDHPFNQIRVSLAKDLLEADNHLERNDMIKPRKATDEELVLFHDKVYVETVKKCGTNQLTEKEALPFGLGTQDTPIFPKMHEATAMLVGGTLQAIDAVLKDGYTHALNISGGLHHGLKRKASGFCVYNDAAVGIKYIREKYDLRVLYIDTDAHHGDGVQWAFYEDPNVCTLSIHETGRYLFPGTGAVNERGIKDGHGYTFNVPIDAFTQDESFLQVFETAVAKVAAFFKPDIIVSQNGADAHFHDPLTHLCASMRIYERIPTLVHELAHTYCQGRWIGLGGGGYDHWRVTPRAWAQIWQVMRYGKVKKGALPEAWLAKWQERSPVQLPAYWDDPESVLPTIPRKSEIAEKNERMLQEAMKYARKLD